MPPVAYAAPATRDEALADLEHARTERRAQAVVWIANHGRVDDQPLLVEHLRDHDPLVRQFAEQYERAMEDWRRALEVNPNLTGVEINLRGTEELLRQKRARTA